MPDQNEHKPNDADSRQTECGFCENGTWHDPGSDRMEECPYCYGSGLANPEERFEEALRDIK